MSFGQEMKDFVAGYKTGEDIKEGRDRHQAALDTHEKNRLFREDEVSGGSLAGAAPAIPETSGGGGGGGGGSGRGMKGDELAWADATPEQRGLLNAIAGPESGGRYDVIYGGKDRVTDFRDHPRKDVLIRTGPNAKRTSSAAGKYQFLGSTWDDVRKKHPDVTDFSPANQDKAAWYLASDTYKAKTGQDLATVLKTGDTAQIANVGKVLSPVWTSLPSGIEQGQNTNTFVSNFTKYRDSSPQPATETAGSAAAPAAAGQDPADFAEKLPTGKEGEGEKQAALSPEAGIPMPEETQFAQVEQPIIKPEDEWGNQTVFAASGGVIPEPQHFETGGQPYVPEPNPNNPSNAANGGDKYSRFRNYTQPIAASPSPAASAAPRISFPTAAPAATAGPSASQLAFANLRAARPVAAAAPAPAPAAAAPVAAKKTGKPLGQMVYAPGGGQGGQQQFFQIPVGRGPNRNWAEGGMIPEPEQYYARGGKVDPDAHFKELIRQESRQRSQHSDDGGESPRDRAARRISAEKGKASSTAYHMHNEYWTPAKPKGGGGGGGKKAGTDKTKTGSTDKTPHVRHPPNPKVGKPEIEEDRKTRFRVGDLPADEDRATRFRPGEGAIPMPDQLPGLPIELQDQNAAPDPRLAGTPRELQDQVPQAAGTPTHGYEPPTGNFPPRPPIPIVQQSGTPRQRYDEEIRTSVPSLTSQPPAPQQSSPAPPQTQPAPIVAPAAPSTKVGPTAEGAPRSTVGTSKVPAANAVTDHYSQPAIPAPEDDGSYPDVPEQDWSGASDQRQQIGSTLLRSILNPTGRRLLGFAAGGAVPEPGEPGYNEAVGRANAEPAAGGAVVTPEFSREANQSARGSGGPGPGTAYPAIASPGDLTASIPPPQEKHRPTPKLLSDVATALHHGAQFLTQHFGLNQQGAVPTPESQQASQDGARRFAEGEGATTPQEIQAIDDKIDPQRQMSEGDRQMTRSAKIVQWYLERGRKEDASAAAAGLMQYGAQRFSQIGSLAAAGYRKYQQTQDPKDLENTLNALKSAYQMIPDGGGMDIAIDPKTHQIVATHTDEDGKETNMPVKPEDLPNIIRSVQDKSAYWQQVMTLADPEGQHIKQRDAASKSEWNRQHGIERGEKLVDADAAAKAEAAKNDRERQETIDTEKRAAAQKEADYKQKQADDLAKEGRTKEDENTRALRDAAIRRAEKALENSKGVNWDTLNPLLNAATDAASAEDADTDEGKARIAEAQSRVFDALPEKTRVNDFSNLGYDRSTLNYVPAGKFLEATGDKPPADHPDAVKGTDKNTGKPIWVIIKDGKQYGVPVS